MSDTRASDRSLSAAALDALQRGNVIEAIKIVRLDGRLGLKEAKDLVDAYLRDHPEVRGPIEEQSQSASRASLFWILLIAGAGAAVVLLLRGR